VTTRNELEALNRSGLIERARRLGVPRPEVMTRVEMIDEIIRRQETDVNARRRARGWLGVARDLVASLIEQGLNMPDAAELVRQGVAPTRVLHQAPVATVTLAEIYAAQGHLKRALGMLDQVLENEPDHAAARALRDRLATPRPAPARVVEPEAPEDVPAPESEELPAAPAPGDEVWDESPPDESPPVEAELLPATPPGFEVASAVVEVETVEVASAVVEVASAVVEVEVVEVEAVEVEVAVEAPARAPEPRADDPPPRTDVLVAIPRGGALFLHWELSDRARAAAADQSWVVRIAALSPCLTGARKLQRDVVVREPAGSLVVPGLGASAVVRAALGQVDASEFLPRVIATVLDENGVAFLPAGAHVDAPSVARARAAALRGA
jgi:hypothetical protein